MPAVLARSSPSGSNGPALSRHRLKRERRAWIAPHAPDFLVSCSQDPVATRNVQSHQICFFRLPNTLPAVIDMGMNVSSAMLPGDGPAFMTRDSILEAACLANIQCDPSGWRLLSKDVVSGSIAPCAREVADLVVVSAPAGASRNMRVAHSRFLIEALQSEPFALFEHQLGCRMRNVNLLKEKTPRAGRSLTPPVPTCRADHRQPLLICVWIVAFFPILSNTTLGLNSANHNGASRWQTLLHLRLPRPCRTFWAG
jgi:hypothetical protein